MILLHDVTMQTVCNIFLTILLRDITIQTVSVVTQLLLGQQRNNVTTFHQQYAVQFLQTPGLSG
jgi:hypothetical protein